MIFKRIMQIWACAVKLFENVQNLLAFSHSIVIQNIQISKFDKLVNTVDYFVKLNFIQKKKKFFKFK